MLNARSRLLFFKLSTTAFLAAIVTGVGAHAIADMGELTHFNCRSQNNRVRCELTHEPLIGRLQTLYLGGVLDKVVSRLDRATKLKSIDE